MLRQVNRIYTVTWKITGRIEVNASSPDNAEAIVNDIEDPEELIKHSIMMDWEATGAQSNLI